MLDTATLAKLKQEFGPRVKKLRMSRGITQTALAEMIGTKSAAITKYESQNNYPGVKGLIQLATIFEVSTDYLIFGEASATAQNSISANSSFVQSNIQANNGCVVVNGHFLSPESMELLRIFDGLKVRDRFELLRIAFDMEQKAIAQKAEDES